MNRVVAFVNVGIIGFFLVIGFKTLVAQLKVRIVNIVFILVVALGFSLIWVPFVVKENETIFKTKNMLSIIPNEILITLPHINVMLGIDDEKN